MMINRYAFRAQMLPQTANEAVLYLESRSQTIQKYIDDKILITLSVFQCENALFLYYETIDSTFSPCQIFDRSEQYLLPWPGQEVPRYWVPMADIFHYNQPENIEHWIRKHADKKGNARIAILKLENISSYIYYHYQYQEEKPEVRHKYGMIFLYENLLFFYNEDPGTKELPIQEGKLKTRNTPQNWAEVMEPHFVFWEHPITEKIWRTIDLILSV